MSTLKSSLLLAGLIAMSSPFAQNTTPSAAEKHVAGMTKEQAKAAHERIEATAKADKAKCQGLKGNAEDICEAEAKAKEKVAKAELQYQQSGSERDRVKLEETRAEAAYEVAKEKCEDQKGDAERACKKQAKADEQAARAHAKAAAKG